MMRIAGFFCPSNWITKYVYLCIDFLPVTYIPGRNSSYAKWPFIHAFSSCNSILSIDRIGDESFIIFSRPIRTDVAEKFGGVLTCKFTIGPKIYWSGWPVYHLKCLCSRRKEAEKEGCHSHQLFNIWFLWYEELVIQIWLWYLCWLQNSKSLKLRWPFFSRFIK